MSELSDEQLARMPYQKEPATSWDVTEEVVRLSSLVSAVVVGNPRRAARLIQDGKNEPGTSIVIQQTRLALALESFVGEHIDNLIETFVESIKAEL